MDLSSKADLAEDNSPGVVKDEDDDDEDDGEDKMDSQVYDPERLKAFNVIIFRLLSLALFLNKNRCR